VGIEFRVEIYSKKLQILPLTPQYILRLLVNHNLDTRKRNNLYLPQANLTIYQKAAYYSGTKIFNN